MTTIVEFASLQYASSKLFMITLIRLTSKLNIFPKRAINIYVYCSRCEC